MDDRAAAPFPARPSTMSSRQWQRWTAGALSGLLFLCLVLQGSQELLWPLGNWMVEPQNSQHPVP